MKDKSERTFLAQVPNAEKRSLQFQEVRNIIPNPSLGILLIRRTIPRPRPWLLLRPPPSPPTRSLGPEPWLTGQSCLLHSLCPLHSRPPWNQNAVETCLTLHQ